MVAICPILQIHSSLSLADYRLNSIGKNHSYFDSRNNDRFKVVAKKVLWPLAHGLASLFKNHKESMQISLSFSGCYLENCETITPPLLEFFQDLISFPNCDLVASPKYNSIASLVSEEEFLWQTKTHTRNLQKIFSKKPKAFHNSELIYSDFIGKMVSNLGFSGCIIPGWEPILPEKHSSSQLFYYHGDNNLSLLLSSCALTADLNDFLNSGGDTSFPISPERYINWIERELQTSSQIVPLFFKIDISKPSTLRFVEFFTAVLNKIIEHPALHLVTVSEALKSFKAQKSLSITRPISASHRIHDLSPWLGDTLQHDILDNLIMLGTKIKESGADDLMNQWRKLLAIENLEHLRIDFFSSEDEMLKKSQLSPYDAYLRIKNILEDLSLRVSSLEKEKNLPPDLKNHEKSIADKAVLLQLQH